jgi:hypothetical protein
MPNSETKSIYIKFNLFTFFCWLQFVRYSFANVAHFVFSRNVEHKRAAVVSRRATNLATHLPKLATY